MCLGPGWSLAGVSKDETVTHTHMIGELYSAEEGDDDRGPLLLFSSH